MADIRLHQLAWEANILMNLMMHYTRLSNDHPIRTKTCISKQPRNYSSIQTIIFYIKLTLSHHSHQRLYYLGQSGNFIFSPHLRTILNHLINYCIMENSNILTSSFGDQLSLK